MCTCYEAVQFMSVIPDSPNCDISNWWYFITYVNPTVAELSNLMGNMNKNFSAIAKETLRKLRAAQFVREHGEVCPANWEPGKATLKPGIALVGKI